VEFAKDGRIFFSLVSIGVLLISMRGGGFLTTSGLGGLIFLK
jgi:hypothetical protein